MSDSGAHAAKDVVQRGKISRWHQAPGVSLSTEVLQRAGLVLDEDVDVVARDGEITIRRHREATGLAKLLERFDPTRHRRELILDAVPSWDRDIP